MFCRYLNDYEESSLMVLKRTGKYGADSIKNLSWNPTLAFRTVWRFSKYLSKWAQPTNYFSKNQTEKIESKFKSIKSNLLLKTSNFLPFRSVVGSIKIVIDGKYNASDGPTSRDMKDAFMALLRLVDVLDLNVENVTRLTFPTRTTIICSMGLFASSLQGPYLESAAWG